MSMTYQHICLSGSANLVEGSPLTGINVYIHVQVLLQVCLEQGLPS